MAVAAYAAVVSLMHVLDQIHQYPSWHRLHLDRDIIEILREKVSFLQDFLELYSQIKSKEIEDLARQISDVAVEVEDLIDTHVVDQLRAISADKSGPANEAEDIVDSHVVNQIREGFPDHSEALALFCRNIERVMEKVDSIEGKLMMVEERMTVQVQVQKPRVSAPAVSTAVPSIAGGKNTMVGFDEHLVRIMDELTGYRSDLQILPIVGMGGIGKTTLSGNVFHNSLIVYHFDVRLWVTISQEYSLNGILLGLLQDMGVCQKGEKSGEDFAELGEKLYKSLSGRRYLIVMDDVWSPNVWNEIKMFFPDNKNGSRVMVTTRLSNVAISLGCQNPYYMSFLDEDQSWNLLCEKAFAQKGCPSELEEIGKRIAKSCKGLPLAIVVIGGLLSTSNMTREYLEFVAKNVNSFANSENDEHCLKILSLSYNQLPIHLKPCFLYMGVFSEDDEIKVSELIKLWVAEGFLKPITGKNLEEVAEKYLKDLIDKNLILTHKWKLSGKIKTCNIHDLLRDFCIRESQKERLVSIPRKQKKRFVKYEDTCFLCDRDTRERISLSQAIVASQATSTVSCSICDVCRCTYTRINAVRLVRLIDAVDGPYDRPFSREILHPTKLRYFSLKVPHEFDFLSNSMPLLWNLQTLIIHQKSFNRQTIVLPSEMWEMPQLRHLIIMDEAILPDPVATQIDRTGPTIILENLQTLSTILNFTCLEEVPERVPNLKKLKICYSEIGNMELSCYSLHNLAHLQKLESLYLEWCLDSFTLKRVVFPHSLKTLILMFCGIPWEEMTIIGSLPNLEVLKLYHHAFKGPVWSPVEGEFLRLKLLLIEGSDLECWGEENFDFPNLESLVLRFMFKLREIPLGIGDIETLRLIDLSFCYKSVVNSAKEILEEQKNLGIEGLQLRLQDSGN